MTQFRFLGIGEDMAVQVRKKLRSPQYGHPAHQEVAQGYGPCRVCLRTFDIGVEDRILFTYQPFSDPGSLPSPGPVFIHAHRCQPYDACELPPDFRKLPIVFEAYGSGGRLVAQERVGAQSPEEVLARMFGTGQASYVHIRNGEAGCFIARVEPCAGD